MTSAVKPWWETLRLRDEVVHSSGDIDDVQMSLYRAVYATGDDRALYADTGYYGNITHPSPQFIDVTAKAAVRLAATNYAATPALLRLDQAMGGGKSHGLIGLYHLAAHPEEFSKTDVGRLALAEAARIAGSKLPHDLNHPHAVVLACDNMVAGKGVYDIDGPAVTLHERFLWRLFSGDRALYNQYQPYHADKSKLMDALRTVGHPVLILVDEIMDYIRQLSDSQLHDLAVKDMAFLKALLDAVNDVPHVVMVVVMIASDMDSMDLDVYGQSRRAELDQLLVRNGRPATINDNTDFSAILRRRLFDEAPSEDVLSATAQLFEQVMSRSWKTKVFDALGTLWVKEWQDEVARCYPFHPQLIHLAEQEWAKLSGYQRVRSTIRIFAAAVFTQAQRAKSGEWTALLIGPGDLPLSSAVVREAVIGSGLISDTRTQANYRSIASADIVGGDDQSGSARTLDRLREGALHGDVNPRAAERAATCLFLCSIVGSRAGGKRGATEPELKAAMFVPDKSFGLADADAILSELKEVDGGGLASVEEIAGKGGQLPRLFMSTRQTLNMRFRAARVSISEDERDVEMARTAERLFTTGPFKAKVVVEGDLTRSPREVLETSGIDNARTTRLVLLDSRQFSLLNGIDKDTRAAIRAAMGIGPEKMAVQWASSAVFAVVNTQKRGLARGQALTYLAWERVAGYEDVKADDELLEKAKAEKGEAHKDLEKAVKRAYQHIVYLALGDESAGESRVDRTITLEAENETALDGTAVWKKLVENQKAVNEDAFGGHALVHNLREDDYGRPLDEVRDLFWNSPRMPLLPRGDADLQRAIYEAIQEQKILLVGTDGIERPVKSPGEIGVGQSGLRLAAFVPLEICPNCGGPPHVGQPCPQLVAPLPPPTPSPAPEEAREKQLVFVLRTSLFDDRKKESLFFLLDTLAANVDAGKSSYAEIMVRMRISGDAADEIAERARALGVDPTISEV